MLLAIDTCGPIGSIALGRLSGELVAQVELTPKTHAALLVPQIRTLLEQNGADWSRLEAIFITNGPGSFTGVRIGVSAAKGLAEALGKPVIAVSRLAVLALKGGTQCAALDAGRGEFYFRDNATLRELLLSLDKITTCSLAVCEESAARAFPAAAFFAPPTAADAIALGLEKLRAGAFDDVATLDGNYLRRSDAELFPKKKVVPLPVSDEPA